MFRRWSASRSLGRAWLLKTVNTLMFNWKIKEINIWKYIVRQWQGLECSLEQFHLHCWKLETDFRKLGSHESSETSESHIRVRFENVKELGVGVEISHNYHQLNGVVFAGEKQASRVSNEDKQMPLPKHSWRLLEYLFWYFLFFFGGEGGSNWQH